MCCACSCWIPQAGQTQPSRGHFTPRPRAQTQPGGTKNRFSRAPVSWLTQPALPSYTLQRSSPCLFIKIRGEAHPPQSSPLYQPCITPPASPLTHQQSSQPNYPMHHPIPFLLTITFKTPAQSPHGSVSSCIISTFGIFIMLRTRSPTKGQFILKANPCLGGCRSQQAAVVPTQPAGRVESPAEPNSIHSVLRWGMRPGKEQQPQIHQ